MVEPFVWLSPGDPCDNTDRLQCLTDFWDQLAVGGDAGGTTWEVLEEIKAEFDKSRRQVPMDLTRMEALTAYAACLMTSRTDS